MTDDSPRLPTPSGARIPRRESCERAFEEYCAMAIAEDDRGSLTRAAMAAASYASGVSEAIRWTERRFGAQAADDLAAHLNVTMTEAVAGTFDELYLSDRLQDPAEG